VAEFRFGGELPHVPEHLTDPAARDVDYAWMFDNVAGLTTERWFHAAGCRRWLTLRRDTRTDRVVEVLS
jgi:heterotetrameric sarcosine oxidase delta subunit